MPTRGFTIDVNLTDGLAHQVALYRVDWDGWGRSLRAEVVDAATGAVLDTPGWPAVPERPVPGVVAQRSRHAPLVNTGPPNASSAASSSTAGGGHYAAGVGRRQPPSRKPTTPPRALGAACTAARATRWPATPRAPAWAQVSIASAPTWHVAHGDRRPPRACGGPTAASRLAACWYADSAFTLDVNVEDGASHSVALYMLDWDSVGTRPAGRRASMPRPVRCSTRGRSPSFRTGAISCGR